ncbi:hypothetical protein P0Y35_12160 [Kiritimatiellaeota bacterium B1221]|nr:hypothetical protein [Kiritimatiellaeota bacterium B1221]
MKNIFALAVLTFSLLIPSTAFPAEMEEMFTDAYLAMLDANKLMEEKKPVEALKLYQQSLQTYQNLQAKDPAYKPENVQIRIAQISEKISSLSQQLPDSQSLNTAEAPVTTNPEEQDFKMLYFQTREQMVRDSGRLLDLEKRNIQMTVTLRERQQEVERLKQSVLNAEKQLRLAKSEQSQSHAALEKEVKDLSRFNMLLQDRADKLEVTSAQLEKQREDLLVNGEALQAELAALKAQHTALRNEFQESKRVSTLDKQSMILTRNQLQDDLAAKQEDVNKLKTQLTALQAKLKNVSLLEETVIELNRQNENQLTQLSELKKERDDAKTAAAEKATAFAEVEAALQQSNSQLEKLLQEKAAWANAKTETENLQTELKEKLAASDQRFEDLQSELEKALKAKESAEQERAEVLSQRGEYRDEMKTVVSKNKALQKERDRLKKDAEILKSDQSKYEEALSKLKLENEAAKQELQTLQQTYRDELAEFKSLKKDSEKWEEEKAEMLQQLKAKTADMETLAKEISKLRTNLSKETVARGQTELLNKNLESKLSVSETERNRLALNLQQESDQRKLLEKMRSSK